MVRVEPRRVEIVGVAGTGKSTLARTLVHRYPECRAADFLHTRSPDHWRYVAHSVPRVAPLLARTAQLSSFLSWDEVKLLVYVSEWSRYLDSHQPNRIGTTVLDQGPLYALACLLWGRKPATRHVRFRAWMDEMLAHWSRELGLIVWLEASDDVLLERINDRAQGHAAKGEVAETALELLRRHGDAYGYVLGQIERLGQPPVRRLDTSTRSSDDIADEVGWLLGELGWLTDVSRASNVR